MDLKSGNPWWAVKNGLMIAFPRLEEDIRCEVAVVGGGITGALVADELTRHGHEVVVLDQRNVGWGSTAASTALLQYELDTTMVDLARRYGEAHAALAYRACDEAIDRIADRASALGDVGHARQRSLQVASRAWHVKALQQEGTLRRRHGIRAKWLSRERIRDEYGFDAPGALLSARASRMDPYRFASKLLLAVRARGGRVYDRTCVEHPGRARRGGVRLLTPRGRVDARHVVMATGYAAQRALPQRLAVNRSSYAFISDPLDRKALGRFASTLFWETARPYLYFRATPDHRLIVGGLDDRIDVPARRDARVLAKARKLRRRIDALLPDLAIEPAFAWAGTFAETKDGLPWFGRHPASPRGVLHAMAYGGNGIVFAMVGAGLLRASIEGRRHPLAALFGFGRDRLER